MMGLLWSEWAEFMAQGGFVMWPLLLGTVALWYGLGYRLMLLRRGSSLEVRELLQQRRENPDAPTCGFIDTAATAALQVAENHEGDIRNYLDDELFSLTESLNRLRTLVRTIVLVAPLAGLLGTVSGMIEMFESLGTQTFYSQSGGVANGISQALTTTELGLVVAIPGMIVGQLLNKREDGMRNEIEQIKELLITEKTAAGGEAGGEKEGQQ